MPCTWGSRNWICTGRRSAKGAVLRFLSVSQGRGKVILFISTCTNHRKQQQDRFRFLPFRDQVLLCLSCHVSGSVAAKPALRAVAERVRGACNGLSPPHLLAAMVSTSRVCDCQRQLGLRAADGGVIEESPPCFLALNGGTWPPLPLQSQLPALNPCQTQHPRQPCHGPRAAPLDSSCRLHDVYMWLLLAAIRISLP